MWVANLPVMLTQLMTRLPVLYKLIRKAKLDAIEQLQFEHMKIESLFLQAKVARGKQIKGRLLASIADEFDAHAQKEESIFYPACRKFEDLKPLVDAALREHGQIKVILGQLRGLSPDDEKTQVKLTSLIRQVMHHVSEEENKLFPGVRKVMTGDRLDKLGVQLRVRRVKKAQAA